VVDSIKSFGMEPFGVNAVGVGLHG